MYTNIYVYISSKIFAKNANICYSDSRHVSLSDIITPADKMYSVVHSDRKMGHISRKPSPFSQSYPPHCPIPMANENICGQQPLPQSDLQIGLSHQSNKFIEDNGVLRKRINEKKCPTDGAKSNDT